MDKAWIKRQMADRNLNQRKLGELIGLDSGATSRLLNGERKLQLVEAAELSLLWEESLDEILVRFGLIEDAGVVKIKLSGIVDADGRMQPLSEEIEIPPPQSAIGKLGSVQIRGKHILDRAIVFYGDAVPVQVDRLSLLLLPDSSVVLGTAHKGYVPGEYKIRTISGNEFESAVSSCRIIADICPL